MPSQLSKEIRQTKPFASASEEVFLNILRTADYLSFQMSQLLKAEGLSLSQYNVLRILRGAGSRGISCSDIVSRMVTHDPDMTRLLDGLERRGLSERRRDSGDRRVVLAHATEKAVEILDRLDQPALELLEKQLGGLGERGLGQLNRLCEKIRANAQAE